MEKNNRKAKTSIYSHIGESYFELAQIFVLINHATVLAPNVPAWRKAYCVGLRTGIRDAVAAENADNSHLQPSGPA